MAHFGVSFIFERQQGPLNVAGAGVTYPPLNIPACTARLAHIADTFPLSVV